MKNIYIILFLLFITNCSYSQNPCPGIPTVAYAGKTYHTVQIGSQCWLKENLDIGTMIDSAQDQTNNGIIEKYCYNNNSANCTIYGGLYQWAEAVQYQNGATNTTLTNPPLTGNVEGICPSGWHIPTRAEYQTLSSSASNNSDALKAVGQGSGTNTSGFSALLAGYRFDGGFFYSLGDFTYFWSSTEGDATEAYYMYLTSYGSSVQFGNRSKVFGLSVRCAKD